MTRNRRHEETDECDARRAPGKRSEDDTGTDDRGSRIRTLHRTVGNQAVQRLVESGEIQAKLRVSSPNDPAEREAERVADQVMGTLDERGETASPERTSGTERDPEVSGGTRGTSTSAPAVTAVEDRTPRIDESPRSGGTAGNQQVGEGVERSLESTSGGRPLSPAARSYFEPRFGRDFGDVRVHTGKEAADLNRQLDAKAFTHGSDVYFGEGQYRPGSGDGKQLMAHELTHVVQQTGDGDRSVGQAHRRTIQRNDECESRPRLSELSASTRGKNTIIFDRKVSRKKAINHIWGEGANVPPSAFAPKGARFAEQVTKRCAREWAVDPRRISLYRQMKDKFRESFNWKFPNVDLEKDGPSIQDFSFNKLAKWYVQIQQEKSRQYGKSISQDWLKLEELVKEEITRRVVTKAVNRDYETLLWWSNNEWVNKTHGYWIRQEIRKYLPEEYDLTRAPEDLPPMRERSPPRAGAGTGTRSGERERRPPRAGAAAGKSDAKQHPDEEIKQVTKALKDAFAERSDVTKREGQAMITGLALASNADPTGVTGLLEHGTKIAQDLNKFDPMDDEDWNNMAVELLNLGIDASKTVSFCSTVVSSGFGTAVVSGLSISLTSYVVIVVTLGYEVFTIGADLKRQHRRFYYIPDFTGIVSAWIFNKKSPHGTLYIKASREEKEGPYGIAEREIALNALTQARKDAEQLWKRKLKPNPGLRYLIKEQSDFKEYWRKMAWKLVNDIKASEKVAEKDAVWVVEDLQS